MELEVKQKLSKYYVIVTERSFSPQYEKYSPLQLSRKSISCGKNNKKIQKYVPKSNKSVLK